jgi:hypothetical protein
MAPGYTSSTLDEGLGPRPARILQTAPGPGTGDTYYLIRESSGRTGWWLSPFGGLGDAQTGDRHATLR